MGDRIPTWLLLITSLAFLVAARPSRAQDQYIYWIGAINGEETKFSTIFRHDLENGVNDTLVRGADLIPEESQYDDPRRFRYVTVDTIGAHIYWTDDGGEIAPNDVIIGAVMRASLDGDSVEIFLGGVQCGLGGLTDIEIDAIERTLYFGESNDCIDFNLIKVNLQGSSDLQVLEMNRNFSVWSIALDPPNGMIYWSHNDDAPVEPVGIWRASLIGLEPEHVVAEEACDIALAHTLSKLYWTSCNGNSIRRSNLDGSDAEDVIVSEGDPAKLAIDHKGRQIYWTETAAGKISRANLDGTGAEDLVSGLIEPASLALNFGWDSSVGVEQETTAPERVELKDVYPNPVRTSATIAFTVTESAHVTFEIYDVLGRKVGMLLDAHVAAGEHAVDWDAGRLPAGVYYLRLATDAYDATRPVVLSR